MDRVAAGEPEQHREDAYGEPAEHDSQDHPDEQLEVPAFLAVAAVRIRIQPMNDIAVRSS